MIMGAWGLGRKRLPYDAEVEYLESTGTQYIDTLWTPTRTAKLTLDCSLSTTSGPPQFGTIEFSSPYKPYYDFCWLGRSNSITNAICYFGNFADRFYVDFKNKLSTNERCVISFDCGTGLGSLATESASYTLQGNPVNSAPPNNFYMFARNFNGPDLFCRMKVYSFAIEDEGILVRDFIPVRFTNEQSVSEASMYDRVSGQLFRNDGTGAFLWAEKQ